MKNLLFALASIILFSCDNRSWPGGAIAKKATNNCDSVKVKAQPIKLITGDCFFLNYGFTVSEFKVKDQNPNGWYCYSNWGEKDIFFISREDVKDKSFKFLHHTLTK